MSARRTASRRSAKGTIRCALALGVATAIAGCVGEADIDSVRATSVTIGRTSQELGIGALLWANGTYGAGCVTRTGSWSVRLSGSDPMDNAALTVVKNNTACVLTLTALVADQTYVGAPAIAMTASYQGSPSSFAPSGAVRFYGNAKLSAATFASNFVVQIVFSDDARGATGGNTAGYASASATSTATSVTSPDYTVDLVTNALAVQVDVDNIVQSVSGVADLVDGTYVGEGYIIDLGTLPSSPTFAELDSAYTAGSPVAIGGANPQIAASAFGLVGVNITTAAARTIVVRRVVSGVRSFQAVKITFTKPS